jgi:hypothetical protein
MAPMGSLQAAPLIVALIFAVPDEGEASVAQELRLLFTYS